MSNLYQLDAEKRQDLGKGASRRLRRENKIPAIIYGGSEQAESITLCHNQLAKALKHESFYSHILTITVDGKPQQAILKDLHRHPFKPKCLHADFQRVSAREKLHVNVPVHFLNEDTAPGAKQGGVVTYLRKDLAITCLPSDLPEYIEVDLAELAMGQSIHLSELKLPSGVALNEQVDDTHDQAVVAIQASRASAEAGDAADSAEEGDK